MVEIEDLLDRGCDSQSVSQSVRYLMPAGA
jgi:hypothetical protein